MMGDALHRRDEVLTIVGAGPAGLSCAIALARAGRAVVVRERQPGVGHRFHGDFQGIENWSDKVDVLDEMEQAGLRTDFDHQGFASGTAFDSRGRAHVLRGSRALFYLVRRGPQSGTLDHALLCQAVQAGVEVRFRDNVRSVDDPGVLAAGPRVADVIAAGYVFDTDMPDGAWLALDDRLAPQGYAYLLVHRGRGTVASCMFSGFKEQARHVAATVDFFVARTGLVMRDARSFGGYGNVRVARAALQGGHPVIGEQAGFQDALAGFGIRYAMRSGLLAACALLCGQDYRALWRRELLPAIRAGVANRFVYSVLGDTGRGAVLARLDDVDAVATLRRLYRPTLISSALFPLAHVLRRRALRDRSCDHQGCRCVWCTHGDAAAASCSGDA